MRSYGVTFSYTPGEPVDPEDRPLEDSAPQSGGEEALA
jgi:hypothetical protein